MERRTAVKKLKVSLIAILLAAMLACTAGAEIITPTAAVASTEFADVVGPRHLIDPTRLNASNQHVARRWGGNWLASDARNTDENWVYIDLGASYDLDEIRIWNYHEEERAEIPELRGRGVRRFSPRTDPCSIASCRPAAARRALFYSSSAAFFLFFDRGLGWLLSGLSEA